MIQHYIYIENQFFVSMIESNDVTNEVCKVIYNRVVRAYKEKENYRVYIMIPLLPGFEGDVGAPGGSSLQAVLHWTYQSLSQGPNSLFQRLKAVMPDPFKYIHVGSLRSYDQLGHKLVSELIYIHCKLLIVDDETVIIGSANINDRSQCGNRDSEVCCVYTDVVKERSMMDGKPYEAGRFAKSLRMRCMKEHLGLLPDSRRKANFPYAVTCDDPVSDRFYVDVWQATSKNNTQIYEEVFRSYPTDFVESFEEFQKWTSQIPMSEYSPQQAEERVRDLRGVLVDFPLNFLCKAVLTPGITSKEGLVPSAVFT
uniref:phospholipase D n=1 Tax=Caenorhabditis japonica TaxID=281687 RepID=A0A8R1IWJ1_CAEJA